MDISSVIRDFGHQSLSDWRSRDDFSEGDYFEAVRFTAMVAVTYESLEHILPRKHSAPHKDERSMRSGVLVAFVLAAVASAVLVYTCTYMQHTSSMHKSTSRHRLWREAAAAADSSECATIRRSSCCSSTAAAAAVPASLLPPSSAAKSSWQIRFNTTQTIPLKLWQTSRSWNLSTKALQAMATWRKLNPSLPVALHSDVTAAQFIKDTYGQEIYDVYQSFPLGVMRADFWRYAILYAYGGIYADIDAKCVRPISHWFPPRQPMWPHDHEVFVKNGTWKSAGGLDHYELSWWDCSIVIGLENSLHMCNWVFASVPGHPIMQEVIQRIVRKAQQGYNFSDIHFVHNHTGPGIWTEAVAETLGLPSQQVSDSGTRIAKAAWTNPATYRRARSLGICIVAAPFFGGATQEPQNVRNLFGSLYFEPGYPKWTDEREKLLEAEKQKAEAAAAAAAAADSSSSSVGDA